MELTNRELNLFSAINAQCRPALAMAYVPIQQFDATYSPDVAIVKGTLFPELDKPFCGRTIMGGDRRA